MPTWILPFCLWSVIGFYVVLIAYVVVRLRAEKKSQKP